MVPKILNFSEKESHVEFYDEMIYAYQDVYLRIITGDDTWIYGYVPETADHSSEYRAKGEARAKQSLQSRSNIKTVLTIFFNYHGVVHYQFLPPPDQSVNKE